MKRRLSSGWELEALQRHIDELFDLLMAPSSQVAAGWTPPVDVLEFEDRFVVRLDLPGVAREHLDISLFERELRIAGVKPTRAGNDCEHRFHRMERSFGPFAVEVLLPGPVEATSTVAALRFGVLEITLPRRRQRRHQVHIIELTPEEP